MRFPYLLAGLVTAAPALHAADISVGADASCTVHTIADALAKAGRDPGIDTIRLANDQTYTDQMIFVGTAVNIVGGHASCGDATPTGRTSLIGTGRWATLAIGANADGAGVRLEHLDVSGGGASGDFGNWGGISIDGHVFVALADVAVHDNRNLFGGGVQISGGAIVEFESNVDIHHNHATAGGGIFVEQATLRMRPHAIAIRDNDAVNAGGLGLYEGAQMSIASNPDDPSPRVDGVLVAGNRADNLGGGVVVAGTNASLLADDIVVRDNSALEGGGVFAGNGSYVQFAVLREGPFRHCPADLECLRLSGNAATRGGAISIRDGASARVDDAVVRNNRAAEGSAFRLYGDASQLRIDGSLVVRNDCADGTSACSTINTSGGSLHFEHSTFADNGGMDSLIWGDGAQDAVLTEIQGHSSLVAGKQKVFDFLGAVPTVHYDCVLKDIGLQEIAATRSDVIAFSFQAPERGDYHLPAGTPAIDWCDGAPISSQSPDRDGTPRGLDAMQDDRYGTYDLGAFESNRIFASGFEARL